MKEDSPLTAAFVILATSAPAVSQPKRQAEYLDSMITSQKGRVLAPLVTTALSDQASPFLAKKELFRMKLGQLYANHALNTSTVEQSVSLNPPDLVLKASCVFQEQFTLSPMTT